MAAFKIITDPEDDSFQIVDPDGGESEWAEAGDICMSDWDGRTFFATDSAELPGMRPGVVYELGTAQKTEAEEFEGDGEEDADEDEEEADAEIDSEEEDEEIE